ncbi:hypothetical protein chiPu_0011157 [Chiloscyllium punctatum]|uniref:Uncharacterized protein n=1 Tax=Chiloscyllium punctatum TaxID=137246 RepID=A0A401SQQ4_CHIPU|nr:hypothetical protein [Chiloscyllium punctatum]
MSGSVVLHCGWELQDIVGAAADNGRCSDRRAVVYLVLNVIEQLSLNLEWVPIPKASGLLLAVLLLLPDLRPELLQPGPPAGAPPAGPHGRAALPLRDLRPRLQAELDPGAAPAHPHRRAAVQLPDLRQGFPPDLHHAGPLPHALRGPALPLPAVRQGLQERVQPDRPPPCPQKLESSAPLTQSPAIPLRAMYIIAKI